MVALPPTSPTPSILGICTNVELIRRIGASKQAAKARENAKIPTKAWTKENCDAVRKLVEVYEENKYEGAFAWYDGLDASEKAKISWQDWTGTIKVLSGRKYKVIADKLHYENREVLLIEHWHSAFVDVYSTHEKFARKRKDNRALGSSTAKKVVAIMSNTYYFNADLLSNCILDAPDTPAVVERQQTNDSVATSGDENALVATENALVATGGDERTDLVIPELYTAAAVTRVNGIVASVPSGTIVNNYFSNFIQNQHQHHGNVNSTVTGTTDMDRRFDNFDNQLKDIKANTEKSIRTLNDIATSTAKKQPRSHTQPDIEGCDLFGATFEIMMAGGSPLPGIDEIGLSNYFEGIGLGSEVHSNKEHDDPMERNHSLLLVSHALSPNIMR